MSRLFGVRAMPDVWDASESPPKLVLHHDGPVGGSDLLLAVLSLYALSLRITRLA